MVTVHNIPNEKVVIYPPSIQYPSFWDVYWWWIFKYVWVLFTISLIIFLCFYVVYKYKKEERPWNHAFKRSWPWWIIVFIVPILVMALLFLYIYRW